MTCAFMIGLLAVATSALGASPPIAIIYVDSAGINWAAQPPTPIVNIVRGVFAVAVLPVLNESVDFASVLTNPNPAYGGQFFVQAMHHAGKKVILTVGGATELPTTSSYFVNNEPVALAHRVAALVTNYTLDGVDIDYEDDYTNGSPGLTGYGVDRVCGGGPAVVWLCTLTSTLRQLLPRASNYTISHAPQPAYFDLGYSSIYTQCGDDIDYFNVQFYNQGPDLYTTYETLALSESITPQPPTCTPSWNGALADIVAHGIPQEKLVVGKIVGPSDGNSGWVDANTFAAIIKQVLQGQFPNLAGVFGWQWGSDLDGSWINTVLTAWS